jgi:ureidoacrylate peracid hydrolase
MKYNQYYNRKPDRWSRDETGLSLVRPQPQPRCIHFEAQPDSITIDIARTALIVVDMQNDFLDEKGWFASTRNANVAPLLTIIPRVNALCAAFRRQQAPVIHLNWGVRADVANLPPNVVDKGSSCGRNAGYGDAISSGNVLVAGSWGAATVPAIDQKDSDISVFKHRLSGFQDNELDQILRRLCVNTLVFTGVNLDRCVFATLMGGCFQGYDAVLVEDATATVSPDYVSEAVTYLVRLLYGFTTKTEPLLAALSLDFQPHTDTNISE